VIDGGNNLPAVIGPETGTIQIGAVQLGRLDAGGHVIQNGGTLDIQGDALGLESQIGDAATENSSWIMNGNSVILYDDPLGGGGDGLNTDGTGKDFDVGKSVPMGATGRLELHDNAALRISDDLKIADGDNGHGVLVMDGNSQVTIGSGMSTSGASTVTVAGNALLLSGNSAGPGLSATGRTNEGYLTLSTATAATATLDIRDSARVYVRTLQQRDGISTVTIRDNGQFHIFEAFTNAQPNLGSATVTGPASGPQRTNHVSSAATAETTISLSGNAAMSIDSDLEDSPWSGFAMSGGTNTGGNAEGGKTLLELADQATFAIAQDLHMTLGTGESATSTLRVRGPGATVTIGGDLRMAIDDLDSENPGTAILNPVLTAGTHTTISVAGTAHIANGSLVVELDGYTPSGGESYRLLTAASIAGSAFRDVQLPALTGGLSWNLVVGSNLVDLIVKSVGDFNGNGTLDAQDIDILSAEAASGANNSAFDLNTDGQVNAEDRRVWVEDLKRIYFGDANLDGQFNSADFVSVFQAGQYEDAIADNSSWSTGDWNGDKDFDSGDFVLAFQAGGYEKGPRMAVRSVPEPGSLFLVAFGCLLLGSCPALRRTIARTG
jgi:hypothetical protein